jgi:drug/metabolite transporter (DMT)-like permease
MIYDVVINKVKFKMKNIAWGISLGVPNFLTLHFFIQALQNSSLASAQIFPIVNMGIIILSSVGGVFLFKEKLTKSNWGGIGLAILAIALIM